VKASRLQLGEGLSSLVLDEGLSPIKKIVLVLKEESSAPGGIYLYI
jgi:hypothetical protein